MFTVFVTFVIAFIISLRMVNKLGNYENFWGYVMNVSLSGALAMLIAIILALIMPKVIAIVCGILSTFGIVYYLLAR